MSFKRSSFCCSALLGVWADQGQNQRPDLLRSLGLPVTASQEDRCGPHSPSLAELRLPRGDAPRARPRPHPLIADSWWPGGPLRHLRRCPRPSPPPPPPRPDSLDLAPSLALSTQPRGPPLSPPQERVAIKGTRPCSGLPRRGLETEAPGLPLGPAASGLRSTAGLAQPLPLPQP